MGFIAAVEERKEKEETSKKWWKGWEPLSPTEWEFLSRQAGVGSLSGWMESFGQFLNADTFSTNDFRGQCAPLESISSFSTPTSFQSAIAVFFFSSVKCRFSSTSTPFSSSL